MTATPLITPECREQKTHQIVWADVGLCCMAANRLRDLLPDSTDKRLAEVTSPK